MKKFCILIATMIAASHLSSCSENKKYHSSSLYEAPETEIVEEVEVKPQKTEGFYERLLENFCQRCYNDCFDNINYKEYSLRIKSFSVVNTEAYIQGVHTYSGWSTHKDVEFTAVVKEKEEDYYEVFFCKDVEYLLDEENGKEAATRNIYYKE